VPNGYWGNLMPAIAYAVDHGAPGASAAWARLTGASNWSVLASAGFDDIPIWGIVPRSFNSSSVEKRFASGKLDVGASRLSFDPNNPSLRIQLGEGLQARYFNLRGEELKAGFHARGKEGR
jgi:hypothetical protein